VLKWEKLTNKKGEPVGFIEVGAKLQKPVSPAETAICKWCHKNFDVATNAPKSCMGAMYHAALSQKKAEALPAKLGKKAAVELAKKQCKWCNEFFSFSTNSATACGGVSAHAARSKIRPARGASKKAL